LGETGEKGGKTHRSAFSPAPEFPTIFPPGQTLPIAQRFGNNLKAIKLDVASVIKEATPGTDSAHPLFLSPFPTFPPPFDLRFSRS